MTGPWWRGGTIYHVYPRSFQDDSGDGVGDLAGIRRRLPYLSWLGVDAVWLSPFYRSPMADFGYDVSDHCDVDPLFGTLGDFDALAAEARRLGLRLILDYVPNHTSSGHPWFHEHPERYLWRDVPNNWLSAFGGPAWSERGGRFYYHAYLPEQPDLDWRRADVREAMLAVLRFWIARGADGFRLDALRQVGKDAEWRDNPPNPDWREGDDDYDKLIPEFSADGPLAHEVSRLLREAAGDKLLIGELYLPIERLVRYYASGIDLPANFHLLTTPWRPEAIAALVERYEAALPAGAWPNWVLSNHDRPRLSRRVGAEQLGNAALLLLTLRGTPTLYYGDEVGLEEVEVPVPRDPWDGGRRDPCRSPMPWDDSPNAGFTKAKPWLPIGPGNAKRNVAAQQQDPASLLALVRRALQVRRQFADAGYRTVKAEGDLLAYRRGDVLVALNLGAGEVAVRADGEVVVGSGELVGGELRLGPHQGAVVR
ncbi:MAG TPA: alpha-amylase family glycosyl hydrolase [Solirubrobacteraceae bacterium]